MNLPNRNDFLRILSRICVILGVIAIVLFIFNVFVFTFFAMLIASALFLMAFAARVLLSKPIKRPRAKNDIQIIRRIK